MDHFLNEMRDWISYLMWGLFSTFGGGVGYVLRSPKVNLRDFIIESVGAGFVGMLVSMGCQASSLDTHYTGIIVGVSSLTGARASLRVMQSVIGKRLGTNPEPEKEDGKAS